jgi:Uma2 family endonuclease
MSLVQNPTMDELRRNQPSLAEIAERRRLGLDTFDEWWDGVYVAVTGPSPEHGMFNVRFGVLLLRLADALGLALAAPLNIGINQRDCRVPDMAVFRPDTPRTSRAFLETAVLVVEILSPGEKAGAKLDFYAEWQVDEYLEVDQRSATARLLRREGDRWVDTPASTLGFRVEPGAIVAGDERVELPPPVD